MKLYLRLGRPRSRCVSERVDFCDFRVKHELAVGIDICCLFYEVAMTKESKKDWPRRAIPVRD